jgi:hypothetical protein
VCGYSDKPRSYVWGPSWWLKGMLILYRSETDRRANVNRQGASTFFHFDRFSPYTRTYNDMDHHMLYRSPVHRTNISLISHRLPLHSQGPLSTDIPCQPERAAVIGPLHDANPPIYEPFRRYHYPSRLAIPVSFSFVGRSPLLSSPFSIYSKHPDKEDHALDRI